MEGNPAKMRTGRRCVGGIMHMFKVCVGAQAACMPACPWYSEFPIFLVCFCFFCHINP